MLEAFTLFHVLLSLIGIASGLVVVYAMTASRNLVGWTAVFLWTTVATSATGFLFPVQHFMPSHAVGLISLALLAVALLGLYRFRLQGAWRRSYAICSVAALYLNVFVLVVQLFQKVPALHALAPTQSEPPFQIAQLAVLAVFGWLGVRATSKFGNAMNRAY